MTLKERAQDFVGKAALKVMASTGWNWRGGSNTTFDGGKFSGALSYPSSWNIDHAGLRDRSRIAYWDSAAARALLGRLVDNTIGTGLTLEASPVWQYIEPPIEEADEPAAPALEGEPKKKSAADIQDEEHREAARDIELRFGLWANSHEPDAAKRLTLYEIQAAEFLNRLRDGETFIILRYSGDSSRLSPLSLQFLDASQVINPDWRTFSSYNQISGSPFTRPTNDLLLANGNRIAEGIEVTPTGEEVAIWVFDETTRKCVRVPVSGPSGRRFVLHPFIGDLTTQVRGTAMLATILHELQKLTDYEVAEIEAAVINAIFAVWIKPGPNANASRGLTGIQARGNTTSPAQPPYPSTGVTNDDYSSKSVFGKPGVIVQTLKAGEEMESFDTKRPNVNFETFVHAVTKMLGASLGIPIEVLEMTFSANYSASRASLILFWNTVEKWRESVVSQFLGPVYEAWFSEEVRAGRIAADGFDGPSPLIRAAWLNSVWTGRSMPSIDPLKEANADDLRIAQCTTTGERVAQHLNGSDFYDNAARRKAELAAMPETPTLVKQPKPALPASDDGEDAPPPVPAKGGKK